MDDRIETAVDGTMCRKICPCTDLGDSVKQWTGRDQKAFNKKGKGAYDFTGKYNKVSQCMKDKKLLFQNMYQRILSKSTFKIIKLLELNFQC